MQCKNVQQPKIQDDSLRAYSGHWQKRFMSSLSDTSINNSLQMSHPGPRHNEEVKATL